MDEKALKECANEARELGQQSRSDVTRARLLQIADRIEAAIRGDEPAPEPIVVKPEPAGIKGRAGEAK